MFKLKYVMLKSKIPILFHEAIKHSSFKHMGIESAGFVSLTVGKGNVIKAYAYGKSTSLKMKPDFDDAKWIEKLIRGE